MKKRKLFLLLANLLMISLLLVACSGKELNEVTESSKDSQTVTEETKENDKSNNEKIIVGTEGSAFKWASVNDKGELEGYDVDTWNEIGKRLGREVEFKLMDWDALWPALEQGKVDSVANMISINATRLDKYHMSDPYAFNVYVLLASKENQEIQSLDDLKTGMKICCQSGSSDEIIVDHINEKYDIELEKVFYSGITVQDIVLGRVDVWPRAETSSIATVEEVPDLKILDRTDVLEKNGFPFVKDDEGKQLQEDVNKIIEEMKNDGTLKEISEKWFDVDLTIEPEGFIVLD